VISNWFRHQLFGFTAGKVATVHIFGLALDLAVIKLGIAQPCKYILSKATFRNVTSVKSTVAVGPLTHFMTELLSLLRYI
jgi:hypothetical protein